MTFITIISWLYQEISCLMNLKFTLYQENSLTQQILDFLEVLSWIVKNFFAFENEEKDFNCSFAMRSFFVIVVGTFHLHQD